MNRVKALSYDTEHVAKHPECGYCLTKHTQVAAPEQPEITCK